MSFNLVARALVADLERRALYVMSIGGEECLSSGGWAVDGNIMLSPFPEDEITDGPRFDFHGAVVVRVSHLQCGRVEVEFKALSALIDGVAL